MKHKGIFPIIIVLSFNACVNSDTGETFPVDVNLDAQTERYRTDKKSIERTYIDNIESVRLSQRQQEGFTVNEDSINPEISSGYWIYTPYALRFKTDYKRVASPIRTDERILLYVDTLTYSRDSLFCVALVIVKVKNDKNPDFEIPKDSCHYDGRAIIGTRKDKDDPFYLFPMDVWTIIGDHSYGIARRELRNFYFNRISGFASWDGKYSCGIGNPEFFNSAPDFKIDSLGYHLFESFEDLGKRYHYYNYKK